MRFIFLIFFAILTPLTHASARDEVSILEEAIYRITLGTVEDAMLLVKRLPSPNTTDKLGWPLIAIAASRTDELALPMVQALYDAGADVNYDGGRKNFPLIFAIQSGNASVVQYLLDRGANYRATDAYGVKIVDFARQTGNKEIIAMVEEAVDKDVLGLAQERTQEFLDDLTYKLAFNSCAATYYSYYYATKQDPVPKETQDKTLKRHADIYKRSMSKMSGIFRIPSPMIGEIYTNAGQKMYSEMENLVSNRNRRAKGVGQPGDMEKRCKRLCEEYKEGIFKKEDYENSLDYR